MIWLYNHRLGLYKFFTAWFVILTVYYAIEIALVLAADGLPYSDTIFAVLTLWWAWDSYDEVNRIRWENYNKS